MCKMTWQHKPNVINLNGKLAFTAETFTFIGYKSG